MNKLTILIIMLLALTKAYAQQISGKVVNEQDMPMEYASVALINTADSSLISGGLTDEEGKFVVNDTTHCKTLAVRVTSLGYETAYADIPLNGAIRMQPQAKALEGITVTGVRKFIKHNASGLTIDMVGNPLAKLPSVNDAIRMMPMIDATSGGIAVLGKGTPEIYINNRRVRNSSELSQLSPENIKSVDIITDPSVKYGSSVTSVIIIHTKKRDNGMAGVITGSGTMSEVASGNVNADFSYVLKNGLGFFVGSSVADSGFKQDRTYDEKFNNNQNYTLTEGEYNSRSKSMNLQAGSSFDFGESNSAGVRYQFSRTPSSKYNTDSNIKTNADGHESSIASANESLSQSMQHYLNGYATIKFGAKKNFEITADADYLYGESRNNQNTTEDSKGIYSIVNTSNRASYHLIATKANLNMAFGKLSIDVGGEYSYTSDRTDFGSIIDSTGSQANDFIKQNLAAGYVNATYRPLNNLTLTAGMRAEATDFTYYKNGKQIDGQSKSYTDWLPRFIISYAVKDLRIGLSYNTNVYRPSYSMLNNNSTYVSHTSWETGNPLLSSSTPHNINLSMAWKQTMLNVTYIRMKRQIEYVYMHMPDYNLNIRKPINLPDFNKLNIVLSHSMDIGFWHPMIQGQLAICDLKYGSPEESYNKPIGSISLQNRFDLPWGIYAYLTGWWSSKGNNNTYYMYDNASVYVYLLKSIGNWSFSLLANDIFGTQKQKHLTRTNGVNVTEYRKGASQLIQLSVTYSFNSKNKKKYKGKGTGSSELNRF